jgi:type II secretory pathway component PulM
MVVWAQFDPRSRGAWMGWVAGLLAALLAAALWRSRERFRES